MSCYSKSEQISSGDNHKAESLARSMRREVTVSNFCASRITAQSMIVITVAFTL